MRHGRRRLLLAIAAALALSCQSQDQTRLAVTVFSDLRVPEELEVLRIEAIGPQGPKYFEYVLTTQPEKGKKVLPVQVVLIPQSSKDAIFTVKATGFRNRNEAVVSRSARLSFLPGEARELALFLNRDCYQRECEVDKTCQAGKCIPIDVKTSTLPRYTTNIVGNAANPSAGLFLDASTTTMDGGSETGTAFIEDAPVAAPEVDSNRDVSRDGTGTTADTPPAVIDTRVDSVWIPPPDTGSSTPDTVPSLIGDANPSVDTTVPADTRPAPDTNLSIDTGVVPIDTGIPVDTTPPVDSPQPVPDTALPDTAVDAPCPTVCTPGEKRCGLTGIQTCTTLPNGCVGWDTDVACGLRQACTGSAPNAQCTCLASPSTSCPGNGAITTGTFCDTQGILQSCLRDSDGCYYLGTAQTCPTGKPCEGAFGSASCSCAAPAAPCTSSAGTFCTANNTQVATCAFDSATTCLANTATTPCGAGKSCVQTASNTAECQCPTLPDCDAANEINQGYCSANTAVTCSTDTNGCQQVARNTCSAQRVCAVANNVASCNCVATSCRDSSNNVFSGTTCDSETQILACGTTDGCPSVSVSATCATNSYCRTSGTGASCLTAYGWYADLGGSGARASAALIGHPVTLTTSATLSRFGVIARTVASVKMGLYLDGGSLVASTEGVMAVGRNEFAPLVTTVLQPGKYWIMANYSASVTIAQQDGSSSERRLLSHTYGNPLPTTLSGATSTASTQSNYYILVTP